MTRGRCLLVAPIVVSALVLTSCGSGGFSGLYGAPLPGGADLGDHPFHATADFADVLDLVPQSSVKVNDVAVGRVDRIDLAQDNKTAEVALTVNGNVRLPANVRAELRQSSLLGEKYVELFPPSTEPPAGQLRDGAVIPKDHTNRNADVEEVLGALSLLLNGGGVQQLSGIVHELNAAMVGKEPQLRATLSTVDTMVKNLDGQKANITRAIDGLNRLSATLAGQTQHIGNALDNLAPGLQVINQQRDQLVAMLQALNTLSGVTVDTINKSRNDLIADLKLLRPTLQQLAASGSDLPKAMQILLSYPFPDYAARIQKGDFANADVNFELDLDQLVKVIGSQPTPGIPLPIPQQPGPGGAVPTPGLPLPLPPLPNLPLPLPGQPPAGSSPGSGGLFSWLPGGR